MLTIRHSTDTLQMHARRMNDGETKATELRDREIDRHAIYRTQDKAEDKETMKRVNKRVK